MIQIHETFTSDCNIAAMDTGVLPSEMDQIRQVITKFKDVWVNRLKETESPFLYLKRQELPSPFALQIFKDGRIWIHTKQAMYGTAKQAKVIVEWGTGKQYVKASTLKHLRKGGPWLRMGDRIVSECKIYEILKGKRGIVSLVDVFSYPSKSSQDNKKTALVLERWTTSLEQSIKWTKDDLKVIAIDLLYALKAFKEAGLTEGDFNRGNVLVLCDKDGKAKKAGLIDFEQTEELSKVIERGYNQPENLRRLFKPQTVEFDFQNEVLSLINSLYTENKIDLPEVQQILNKGYYQQGGEFFGGKFEEHIPTSTIDEMIEKFAASIL